MADNVTLPATGAGDATPVISTEEVTTLNGGAVTAQQVQRAAIVTIASSGVADDVGSGNPLPVSVASVPGNVTVVQPTGTNLHTVVDSGTLTTVSTVTAVTGVTNPVTVIQGTATSLKTQAENYQGGVAVGAAAPLQVTLANTGANATPVAVSLASAPSTSVTQGTSPWVVAGSGTAGTANAGVVSVQGIASMTPVQVSQATASNLNATVSQATGTNLHTVVDSGTLTTVSTVTAVTSITNPVTVAQATATSLKAEVIGAGTAGTANAGVVTVQGIAAMTPLLVTPAANSAVNVAQLAGTATSVNSGNKDAGTLRVTLATDQVQLTNALKVTGTGSAGTADTGVVTIQGIASGTTVPVSGTVTATVAVKAILWQAAWTSRGDVLTTELNSLADGAFSAVGSAVDNTSNLDQYGACEVNLASLNPTAGAFLQLFMVQSLGGTNYEDAPSSTNPGLHMLVATMNVTTGSATKRISTPTFRIPPGKFKFVLYQDVNVSFASSANTVTLYTSNDEIQ